MSKIVLNLDEVAEEIRCTAKTAHERRRVVRNLIVNGDLRVINPNVSCRRWTVSIFEVRRYLGYPDALVAIEVQP